MTSVANQIPIAEGLFTWPSNDPRLLGSKCNDCGVVTFPAQAGCPACCGEDTTNIELERQGTLWTWTIQGFLPNRPALRWTGNARNPSSLLPSATSSCRTRSGCRPASSATT